MTPYTQDPPLKTRGGAPEEAIIEGYLTMGVETRLS